MRPLSLRTWGRILTENGEIVPFLNKQPCISVIFIPKTAFRIGRPFLYLRSRNLILLTFRFLPPFYLSPLIEPGEKTLAKSVVKNVCSKKEIESLVSQSIPRLLCAALYLPKWTGKRNKLVYQ